MSLKLEFTGDVVGVAEIVETLVLMCPDPAMKGEVSIVVGKNTSIIRRLFHSCRTHGGDHFLSTLTVHPVIGEAYEKFQKTSENTAETKRGTAWYTRDKPFTLPPGRVIFP